MRAKLLAFMLLAFVGCSASALDLQAHRGDTGLAPENTLAAFARALSLGVTTLELDIAITKDDHGINRRVQLRLLGRHGGA